MAKRINSNAKGKRKELQHGACLSDILNIVLRRTAQVDGSLSADIMGWGGVHIESKGYKRIVALDFLRQAETDSEAQGEGAVPLVIMSENGDTEPVLMLRAKDLLRLCERVSAVVGPVSAINECKHVKIGERD